MPPTEGGGLEITLKIQKLDFEKVKEIYHDYLVKDFIPAEQKPLIVMKILMTMGLYHCYGLYHQDEFCGYAFFCSKGKKRDSVLLDYFVIVEHLRGQGIGSTFMKLLQEEFKDYQRIIAEVETVEGTPNTSEYKIKESRQQFYLRNDWRLTKLSVDLFGEMLQIFELPIKEPATDEIVYQELNEIYDAMFYEETIRKQVILYR